MYKLNDDIVALATLVGRSALSVIRISGGRSKKIYHKLTKTQGSPRPNYVKLCFLYHPYKKTIIDQATIVYYRAPKSFTGEDCLEITTHGGVVIANQVLDACLLIGVREAMPGEFSYRAFINNKIDIIQAEAIDTIVSANNDLDSYYALNNIKGNLSDEIRSSYDLVKEIITIGEHELDFNENEITPDIESGYLKSLNRALSIIKKIIDTSYTLEDNKSSLKIAIIGFPNVGKSSLFNVLIGKSKAIVTDLKGTTRDTIEQSLYISETLITLVDTAGIRKTKHKIEKIGIKKSLEEIESSDMLIVVDDTNPCIVLETIKKEIKEKEVFLVQNKIDVNKKCDKEGVLYISCTKPLGIKELITLLSISIKKQSSSFRSQHSSLINKRQQKILRAIYLDIDRASVSYKKTKDLTLCLSLLYSALDGFNSLIFPADKDEMLNNIFKGFCIGK